MSVIRVGSTNKYAEGWATIFGGRATKKTTKRLAVKKKAVQKSATKKAKKKRK